MEVLIFIALIVGNIATHITMYYIGKTVALLQSIEDRV